MAGIIVFSQNVSSLRLRVRRSEVDQHIKDAKADIALLQETRLNNRNNLELSRMRVYRCDEGVGTAIAIKDQLKSSRVWIAGVVSVDYTAIKIHVNKECILLVSIYVPCNIKSDEYRTDLEALADELHKYAGVIVGGDWNSRHRSWQVCAQDAENCNRVILSKWVKEHPELSQRQTGQYTFRGITNLDFFFISGVVAGTATRATTAWCHSPVLLGTNIRLSGIDQQDRRTRVTYVGTDWDRLRMEVTQSLIDIRLNEEEVMSEEQIDALIRRVTDSVQVTKSKLLKSKEIRARDLAPLPLEV